MILTASLVPLYAFLSVYSLYNLGFINKFPFLLLGIIQRQLLYFGCFFLGGLLHFSPSLSSSLNTSLSNFENANHFLPKSFNDAPKWYTSLLSIIRNLSCDCLNSFTSIA